LFVTLWEFEVKSGSEELFEEAHGPEGEWMQLFRHGCAVSGHAAAARRGSGSAYVTMDSWESREAYEEFKRRYAVEYAEIDSKGKGLTVRKRLLF